MLCLLLCTLELSDLFSNPLLQLFLVLKTLNRSLEPLQFAKNRRMSKVKVLQFQFSFFPLVSLESQGFLRPTGTRDSKSMNVQCFKVKCTFSSCKRIVLPIDRTMQVLRWSNRNTCCFRTGGCSSAGPGANVPFAASLHPLPLTRRRRNSLHLALSPGPDRHWARGSTSHHFAPGVPAKMRERRRRSSKYMNQSAYRRIPIVTPYEHHRTTMHVKS